MLQLTHRMDPSRFASLRINSLTPAKWTRIEVLRSHNLQKDSRLMRIPPKTGSVIKWTNNLEMITIIIIKAMRQRIMVNSISRSSRVRRFQDELSEMLSWISWARAFPNLKWLGRDQGFVNPGTDNQAKYNPNGPFQQGDCDTGEPDMSQF